MKKNPLQTYQRKTKRVPFIGTLAEESLVRQQAWLKNGCNAFNAKKQTSQPHSFWTEQDILKYLYVEGYEIASVYGEIVGVDHEGFEYEPMPGVDCKLKCTGCNRTGCIFCAFGCHMEKKGETRFQRLAKTHPKQYEYCMGGGQWSDNPNYDPSAPEYDGEWKNWNPKKIWTPSKKGLGMKHVFDEVNALYGGNLIRYD
jgi:3'-phosphoadenosine 5'-phosphosulfate sulfotransferase (PAPS reductase)/FAD synthetase